MNVLHHAGLSLSYASIATMITTLANRSIEEARLVGSGPHALAYDNINLSTSIFVEQGPNMASKVQSGTFAVIYELCNAKAEDLKIEPLIHNLTNASLLELSDLRLSHAARTSYFQQTLINITKILFRYVDGFDTIMADPRLQHHSRRALPKGYQTKFHPLRATTIEEASIRGNMLVHDDVYTVQLQRNASDLSSLAIPTINDQLTNARIRGAQEIRRKDVNAWERREVFQLGFGIFHFLMNFIWALLETHRGKLSDSGSLTHFFAILEKTRLGGEHPDYHTLLAALTQVIHGLILNAWRKECGFSSLDAFAKSQPTVDQILVCAHTIAVKYTIPASPLTPLKPKPDLKTKRVLNLVEDDPSSDSGSDDLNGNDSASTANPDNTFENVTRLTRDLLYVLEIVDAVATGDFGRVEDILPDIACVFKGAGSNNYSAEVLHFIFNVKQVWTPEFAYAITCFFFFLNTALTEVFKEYYAR